MTTVHHSLDIYGVELHVVTTRREWTSLRRKHKGLHEWTDSAGFVSAYVRESKNGPSSRHVGIFINAKSHRGDASELVDTCAHEATHVVSLILTGFSGHEIQITDEPHAYLMGWMTRWIWDSVTDKSLKIP